MDNFLKMIRTPRRVISWLLATVMVISTFWYGGISKVRAEGAEEAPEAVEASEGEAVEEEEHTEAPATDEAEQDEEALIGDPGDPAVTAPGIAEGLVCTGADLQLLTSAAQKTDQAPSNSTVVYSTSRNMSILNAKTSYTGITAADAGDHTVYYGYRTGSNVFNYKFTVVDYVVVNIATGDIDKVPVKTVRTGTSIRNYRYSPFTYTGDVIAPNIYLEDAGGNALTENTDYRIESGTTRASAIGEYEITVLGLGNYEGTTTSFTWEIQEDPYIVYPTRNWDIRVQDSESEYDGEAHGLNITLQNKAADAKVAYLLLEDGEEPDWESEEFSDVPCEFVDAGEYDVAWKVYTDEVDMEGNPIHTPVTGVNTVTITPKEVHVYSNEITKVYDGEPFDEEDLAVTQIGEEDGSYAPVEGETIAPEDIRLALSEEAVEAVDVGEYEIEVVNEESLVELYPNYNIIVSIDGYATITSRPLTITLAEESYTKMYSEDAIDFEAELVFEPFDEEAGTGLVDGDEIIGAPVLSTDSESTRTTYAVEDDNLLDAGTYYIHQYYTNNRGRIIEGITPDDNPNYDITFQGGTYTVTKKPIDTESIEVEFAGSETGYYEYTGSRRNISVDLFDVVSGFDCIGSDDYTVTGVTSASNYGKYDIKITATADGNYTGQREEAWGIVAYVSDEFDYDGTTHMLTEDNIEKAIDDGTLIDFRFSMTEPEEDVTIDNYKTLYDLETIDDVKAAFEKADLGKDVGTYTFYYVLRLRGDKFFATSANVVVVPAEIEISAGYTVKDYDGTTEVKFLDQELPILTGVGYEAVYVSNITGNLEEADSNYALGIDESEYRTVYFDEEALAKADITPANENTNPDNYVITVDDEAGCAVYRAELYIEDFEIEVADKDYDGTDLAEVTITAETGIEGEEIAFDDAFGIFKDADVAYDDQGEVIEKPVMVFASAVAGNEETDIANYLIIDDRHVEIRPQIPDYLIGVPAEAIPVALGELVIGEDDYDVYSIESATIYPLEVTITPDSASKTYDGKSVDAETAGLTFTVEGVSEELAEIDELAAEILNNPEDLFAVSFEEGVDVKNAGKYVIYSEADDGLAEEGNFTFKTMTGEYEITPKAVTVKVEDATKKVGEDDPVFKYSVTGLVDGESLKNVKVTRTSGEDVGTYDVYITFDKDDNYEFTFVNGKFTITEGDKPEPAPQPETNYKNEWVDGQWYGADGNTDYAPKGSWKQNASGWWYEDTSGWYPVSCWQKIDGLWYYFKHDGYMASSEWINGWWCDADGSCTYAGVGSWKSDSNGWWYEDTLGWYAVSSWQKIDSIWYYFGNDGYLVTNQYVDGYWVNADGAWAE